MFVFHDIAADGIDDFDYLLRLSMTSFIIHCNVVFGGEVFEFHGHTGSQAVIYSYTLNGKKFIAALSFLYWRPKWYISVGEKSEMGDLIEKTSDH